MRKSTGLIVTLLILTGAHLSYGERYFTRKGIHDRITRRYLNHKPRMYRTKIKSDTWGVADWYWIIDASLSSIEDLLYVNINPAISVFPDYDYVTAVFDGYTWKKWNNWSECSVNGDFYEFKTSFDKDGKITAYKVAEECDYTMTYNTDGTPKEWTVNEYNETSGTWWLYKYKLDYDNKKLNSFIISYEDSGLWCDEEKYEYVYSDDKLTEEGYYSWNYMTDQWDRKYKWVYSYNADGKIKEHKAYTWDTVTSNWILDNYRYTYTYDSKGNLTAYTGHSWDSVANDWKPDGYKYSYSYDENNNFLTETGYAWDTGSSSWKEYGDKFSCTYDGNGNILEELHYIWDENSGEWMPGDYKYTYTYDNDGNLKENIDYVWVDKQRGWVESEKFEFNYNAAGPPESCAIYSYNDTNSEWVPEEELTITFSNINPVKHTIHSPFVKKVVCRQINTGIVFEIDGKPGDNDKLLIVNLRGRVIEDLTPVYTRHRTSYRWNRTTEGKPVGSNLYLYHIRQGDKTLSGKLSIID